MGQTTETAEPVHRVKRGRPAKAIEAPADISAAQAYAIRIWIGQSIDVPVAERVRRVVAGLRDQGLSISITLPHDDAGRYLETY